MKLCVACEGRFEADGWDCPGCRFVPAVKGGYLAFSPALAEANDGFGAEYFTQLAPREAGNFWFRARNQLVTWALGLYFPAASNFLEIGCGTGFVLAGVQREFPQLALAGSEIFTQGLAFARQRLPGVWLFQMDARCIPFESEFDVIGAFDVLEHIEEDEAVLRQMFRATKPGGGVILTVPQHPFLWTVVDEYSCHKRRYTRKELVGKLVRAGFKLTRVTSFVSLLLPLMILSRFRSQRSPKDFDPLAELDINPHLNAALEKVLALEWALLKRGCSFPTGGSLLVVAKRDAR